MLLGRGLVNWAEEDDTLGFFSELDYLVLLVCCDGFPGKAGDWPPDAIVAWDSFAPFVFFVYKGLGGSFPAFLPAPPAFLEAYFSLVLDVS